MNFANRRPLIEASSLQKTALLFALALFLAWEKEGGLFFLVFLVLILLGFKRLFFLWAMVFWVGFIYGGLCFREPSSLKDFPFYKRVCFEAVILKPTLRLKGYSRLEAKILRLLSPDSKRLDLKVRLYAPFPLRLEPGEVFEAEARFRPPRGCLNPFGYEASRAKAAQGIYLVGSLYRKTKIRVLYAQRGFWLQKTRAKLFCLAERLDNPARGLFEALVLGEKSALSPEIRRTFQKLGLFHFLAVSGLHLALLSGLAFWVIKVLVRPFPRLLLFMPLRTWGLLGATFISIIYVFLSGPSPSALRALVMLMIFLTAHLLYREARALDILALAVLVILILWPRAIGSLSFRLSVVAVLGLILAGRLKRRFPFGPKSKMASYLVDVMYYSASATLFTAPFLLLTFGEVSLWAPLANLLALPIFAFLILPAEFMAVFLWPLSPSLAQGLASFPGKIVSRFPTIYDLNFRPPFPVGAFLFGLIPLGCAFLVSSRRAKIFLVLSSVLIEFLFWISYQSLNLVTILDVGQGSSAIAKIGCKTILFDAGPKRGTFDAGSWVVGPTLKKLGLRKLDLVIVSHPQLDHIGGLKSLVQEITVQRVVLGSFRSLADFLVDFSPKLRIIYGPKRIKERDFDLDLWPGRPDSLLKKSNQEGLVARLCLKRPRPFCFLFPGDITQVRERRLLEEGLASDILILPHHGSNTSSSKAFVQAVNPCLAVSSSRYVKHPSKEVLKRLEILGIPHLGTKYCGAISFIFHGEKTWVCTEASRQRENLFFRALWPFILTSCDPLDHTSTTH